MSKKFLSTMVSILLAGLLFSACQTPTPTETPVPTSTQAPPTVTPLPEPTLTPSPTLDPIQALLDHIDTTRNWNDLSGMVDPEFLNLLESLSEGKVKILGAFVTDPNCVACVTARLGLHYGEHFYGKSPVIAIVHHVDSQGHFTGYFCWMTMNPVLVPMDFLDKTRSKATGDSLEKQLISWIKQIQKDYKGD